MPAVLYALPASHPCAAVERALQLKHVDYRRKDGVPVLHRLEQYARFRVPTVPTITFDDGTKRSGSRAIMRALDERAPDPPLLPEAPERRAAVMRAEEWGDQVLQAVVRRLLWGALRRKPSAVMSYSEDADLPIPRPLARLSAPVLVRLGQKANDAGDLNVRADLAHLASHLQRIDTWIGEGAIGGEEANAADLQIGASVRLLSTVEDLRPQLDGRPALELAKRWFPRYAGVLPAGALPAAWL
jgi:glutathione S-transferase